MCKQKGTYYEAMLKNGRTISLEKLEKKMEELHENSSRRLG